VLEIWQHYFPIKVKLLNSEIMITVKWLRPWIKAYLLHTSTSKSLWGNRGWKFISITGSTYVTGCVSFSYLSISRWCSGVGDGTIKDLERYVLAFDPSPNLPLMDDAFTLWRRNFWIISLMQKCLMYVLVAEQEIYTDLVKPNRPY
jgi:hypothetical protein